MQCLFCNSSKIQKASFPRTTLFNAKQFSYHQCAECDLIFINPIPSSDDYAKMYASSYHQQFYFKEVSPDHSNIYGLVEKNTNGRSILDYGCGDGSFLNFFAKKGYKCFGVEYDSNLVALLKLRFPEIIFYTVDEFNKLDEKTRFSNIHLGDVFEHLSDPVNFINLLRTRLIENGLTIVEGPLENNFTIALAYRKLISSLRNETPASHVPYHIIFSNAKNQEEVFTKNGFISVYYNVYETSWPMPEKFSLNPIKLLKWSVGKVSIFFSKIWPGKMGNRFIFLGLKK